MNGTHLRCFKMTYFFNNTKKIVILGDGLASELALGLVAFQMQQIAVHGVEKCCVVDGLRLLVLAILK